MPTILIVGGYGNTGYRVAEFLRPESLLQVLEKQGMQTHVSEG